MNNQSILVEKIPSYWVVKKIKYVFDERKETNDPIQTDVLVSLTHDRGVILHSEKGDIGNKEKDDIKKYKIVHPGDIVINSMNVIIGSSGLSDHFGLVSPVYYTLVKKDPDYDNRFFHYLFRSTIFQKSLIGVGNGILEHRMRVPMDKLGSHFIPLPSSNEQKLISRYLDKKTSQIDSLVQKIQKKVELLKEQRTSLINHYVTKGLDPNVEMKDSGVEWIGQIPKHWDLIKLKYLFSLEGGKDPKLVEIDDGKYPIFGTGGEISRSSDFLYDKPTLLLGRKGTIDKPFVVTEPFWVSDVMYFTVQKTEITPDYLLKLFNLVPFGFYKYGSTQPSMSRIDYENMIFPIPSEEERQFITKFLDRELIKFETLIEKQNSKSSLLKEYRQSLISSVVTGKVRVTEDMI